jgi:hypothetical protein
VSSPRPRRSWRSSSGPDRANEKGRALWNTYRRSIWLPRLRAIPRGGPRPPKRSARRASRSGSLPSWAMASPMPWCGISRTRRARFSPCRWKPRTGLRSRRKRSPAAIPTSAVGPLPIRSASKRRPICMRPTRWVRSTSRRLPCEGRRASVVLHAELLAGGTTGVSPGVRKLLSGHGAALTAYPAVVRSRPRTRRSLFR